MKYKLTIIFLMITLLSFSQGTSVRKDNVLHKINLNLPDIKSSNQVDNSGYVAILFGVALTTACILEGNSNYGTYVSTPTSSNPKQTTYVVPGFFKQSPRQLMLLVGVGFTIAGGVMILK